LDDSQRYCARCGAPNPDAPPSSSAIPFAPPVAASALEVGAEVRVGISMEPPTQTRWSILIRLILVIPLAIVGAGLGIASFFVVIAAWFAALFTGRVPDGMQGFLTNCGRFFSNLLAYEYLVVGRWPGVPFDARPDDQVSLEIDHVELNRAAVFFRIILAIPALIVHQVLTAGAFPILFVMWVWGIFTGKEPPALHQAMALIVRYSIRTFSYVLLLSPTQPFTGMLGDEVEPAAAPAATWGASAPTPEPETLAAGSAGWPSPSAPTSSLPTCFTVVRGARIVVIVAIVLGAILTIAQRSQTNANTNGTSYNGAVATAPTPSWVLPTGR
jgi:hypothetical protein